MHAGEARAWPLIVHHTDAQREWAYDRTSSVGRLDKALDEKLLEGLFGLRIAVYLSWFSSQRLRW